MIENLKYFVINQKCIPWRVKNRYLSWREEWLRHHSRAIYKLLRFGRVDLNSQNYWNHIWATEDPNETRSYDEMYSRIVELVPQNAQVLDIGCGAGLLLRRLRKQKNCEVVGVDISDVAIRELKRYGITGRVSQLPQIPFPSESYDVVVATEVLEHLKDPLATVEQMARVLRKKGLFVVSVPNNCLHPDDELEHLQSFTKEDLIAVLSPFVEVNYVKTGKYFEYQNSNEYLLAGGIKK